MTFTVAIVGRPNVGKSTLFNRLVGQRIALVDDTPGVTRDRREALFELDDHTVRLIDTAGLEDEVKASLQGRMRVQTEIAIETSDLCLFMIDARVGVASMDEHFAQLVRSSGKPVLLLANKSEGRAAEAGMYEAFRLGLGDPIPISAEHGLGIHDVQEAILEAVEAAQDGSSDDQADDDSEKPMRLAIVGQPNAGKSTLINKLLDEERLLTGPEAGITRDSIAVPWTWNGRSIELFDTAGIRRRAKVVDKLEKLSVGDALRAIRFAELVIIIMDATVPLEKQDLQIADLVAREGRAVVLALNKWDLVKDKKERLMEIQADLDETLVQIRGVPLVPISAKTGKGLDRLMNRAFKVHETWGRRISTARLNKWLQDVEARHPPPAVSGRRIRLKYLTQSKARPPTFFLSCSRPDALSESYRRYIVNGLRQDFDLPGVPIRLMVRRDKNPYEKKARSRRIS